MAGTDIKQLLPKTVYDAAVGANSPSASNVFATISDLSGLGNNIYTINGNLTSNRTVSFGGFDLSFVAGAAGNSVEQKWQSGGAFTGIFTNTSDTAGNYVTVTQGLNYYVIDTQGIVAGDGGALELTGIHSRLSFYDGTSGNNTGLYISPTGFKFEDLAYLKGAYYAADYSTAGIATHGNRWIPDVGYVLANSGIYGGSGSTQTGITTVTMAATDTLIFNSLNGPNDLLTIDAVNNRIGLGTSTPSQGFQINTLNTFFNNSRVGIFATPGTGNAKLVITNDGTTSDTSVLRLYPTYSGATGAQHGAYVQTLEDRNNISGSTLYAYRAFLQGTSSAGSHTNYGSYNKLETTATGTGNVTNIAGYFEAANGSSNTAIQIVDGTEALNRVLRSDATGKATWVDPNTLVSTPTLAAVLSTGNTTGANNLVISTGQRIVYNNSGFNSEITTTTLTSDRTITLQDASGTVAYLSDIPAGGGGLSSVLTAGDTGSAGQNINLVGNAGAGGYIDIANGAGGAGPTCLDASLRIQSINTGASDGETNIETTTCRPSLRHDLNLHATTIGSYVTLQSASTGDGLFKVLGNGEATVQFNLSGTNRTIQFQDASGTVAYLTDVQTGQAWTNATNVVTTRGGYDADATTLDALADNLGTLISDLKTVGILS